MARTGRPGLSAEQKRELWIRWKDGQSLSDIGRALGKPAGSIFGVLQAKGGIAPPLRQRSARALTLEEREEISRGLVAGLSLRQIAAQLGRSPSTISREIGRNGGRMQYRAMAADGRSWQQACRPKPCLLATHRSLQAVVAEKLAQQWSPQQVSGWLEVEYPDDEAMRVSHETIYRSLFIQARGVLKKELLATLRSRRLMRRAKTSTTEGQPRGQIIGAVSIRERPAEIEDRAVPGHWEGDLLSGGKNTHVATLVERRSRFLMLVQVDGKDTESVVDALVRQVQQLPRGLMSSLTWDRGMELAQHKRFAVAADVAVYFCDPRSPWQRGSNENTNGLLRQYLPRGSDLSVHSQDDLDTIALRLNTRPRKTLGYKTPAATLAQAVALTS
ncbi:IS30 family transposase (plasmid) [Roseomonas marmotae]|uniref:IS30 family transposase n=2 Tax=Roseomonas marmotae TaxID=2768161 RepID=UPI001AD6B432|nr:IS30 family transposase [Roseomonas marmotae]QTI81148.1 IS30 family transposase [Roseomonas marmotae]QTI81169.1 IS30 family transposase [Roseomonas marmotae]QTI81826.1 IS30 family transposase [Roseomonas marmotae]